MLPELAIKNSGQRPAPRQQINLSHQSTTRSYWPGFRKRFRAYAPAATIPVPSSNTAVGSGLGMVAPLPPSPEPPPEEEAGPLKSPNLFPRFADATLNPKCFPALVSNSRSCACFLINPRCNPLFPSKNSAKRDGIPARISSRKFRWGPSLLFSLATMSSARNESARADEAVSVSKNKTPKQAAHVLASRILTLRDLSLFVKMLPH